MRGRLGLWKLFDSSLRYLGFPLERLELPVASLA
jgi:hypothetical protein